MTLFFATPKTQRRNDSASGGACGEANASASVAWTMSSTSSAGTRLRTIATRSERSAGLRTGAEDMAFTTGRRTGSSECDSESCGSIVFFYAGLTGGFPGPGLDKRGLVHSFCFA